MDEKKELDNIAQFPGPDMIGWPEIREKFESILTRLSLPAAIESEVLGAMRGWFEFMDVSIDGADFPTFKAAVQENRRDVLLKILWAEIDRSTLRRALQERRPGRESD